MPPDISQIAALGIEPTTANPPVGVSLQDEIDFDQLQNDVQYLITGLTANSEMQAIGQREPATWEQISDRAFEMLQKRSKDMRVASFLTISMVYVRGYEGLKPCLEMLHGLLTTFWDNLYPPLKMLRGRINAIDFISSKVAGESDEPGGRMLLHQQKLLAGWDEMLSNNPSSSERAAMLEEIMVQTEALRGVTEAVGKLRDLIYEKFPADKLPSITSLREATTNALGVLDDFVKRNKPKEAAAGDAAASGGGGTSGGGGGGSGSTQRASSGGGGGGMATGPMESVADVFKVLGRAAVVLRQADPSRAASYRLNRWAVWMEWDVEPPTTDGRLTRIPDPQKPELDQARALLSASNWMQLLNSSEDRFSATPILLDRQYWIYMALGGMGPAFKGAQEAVRDELHQFLKRLPNLPRLAYSSGTPFADDTTQAWIAQVVMVEGGGGGGGMSSGGGGAANDESLTAALADARALMADGKQADAIRLLHNGPPAPQSGRSRYLWRMALAQLATDGGKARQAAPLWEELLSVIDEYKLEGWEPSLCLPVYRALWRVLKGDKTQAVASENIFRRLCRLDPAAALEG